MKDKLTLKPVPWRKSGYRIASDLGAEGSEIRFLPLGQRVGIREFQFLSPLEAQIKAL